MKKRAAFTLIEIIVALGIIALLATFSVASFNPLLQSIQITQGVGMVADAFAFARQTAATSNQPAVLRFYRYALNGEPGETAGIPTTGRYRSYQIFTDQGAGKLMASRAVRKIPQMSVISYGEFSTVLSKTGRAEKTATTSDPSIPEVKQAYLYQDIVFYPSGRVLLDPYPTKPWTITVHSARVSDGSSSLPPNFGTITINPLNGTIRVLRP